MGLTLTVSAGFGTMADGITVGITRREGGACLTVSAGFGSKQKAEKFYNTLTINVTLALHSKDLVIN